MYTENVAVYFRSRFLLIIQKLDRISVWSSSIVGQKAVLTLDLYVNGVTEGFSTFERFEHSTGTSVLVQNIIAKAIRKPKRKVARLYQAKTLKAKTLKIIKFKRHYSNNPIEIKDYLLLEFTS